MPQLDGHKIGAIKRAIENYIHPSNRRSFIFSEYENWYIGITNDTKRRKAEHEYKKELETLHFNSWDAGTVQNAVEIEKYFHDKGMKDKASVGNAKKDSIYVYVFKIQPHALDFLFAALASG